MREVPRLNISVGVVGMPRYDCFRLQLAPLVNHQDVLMLGFQLSESSKHFF